NRPDWRRLARHPNPWRTRHDRYARCHPRTRRRARPRPRAEAPVPSRRPESVADRRRLRWWPAGAWRPPVHARWTDLLGADPGTPRRTRHDGRVVARRNPRGDVPGVSHPRRAARHALRHGIVHRLRGDVFFRLLLGVLLLRAVPARRGLA